jgi:hypothetical protein
MEKIQAGIFFDNDAHKIAEVDAYCKNIKLVKIPETPETPHMKYPQVPFEGKLAELYTEINPPDKTPQNLYAFIIKEEVKKDAYDIVSGIGPEQIEILNKWIEETKDIPSRAAIFDWDRTLTTFEGFYPKSQIDWYINKHFKLKISDDDYYSQLLQYLFGGDKRLEMMLNMFKIIHSNNIKIFILTNNRSCNEPEFSKIVKILLSADEDIPFTIICGINYGGNKGLALRSHPAFSICAAAGGRRRRKSMKHRKQKRKTIRRKKLRL